MLRWEVVKFLEDNDVDFIMTLTLKEHVDDVDNGDGNGDNGDAGKPFWVTDRHPLRYQSDTKNGLPVMTIYPSDSAPTDDRVIVDFGEIIGVDPNPKQAYGGGVYYLVVSLGSRVMEDDWPPLYVAGNKGHF